MKLGEGSHLEVEGISTGALSLDLALGGKGLPRGRIIELFGPGVERQDDDRAARGGQRPAERRASPRSSTPSTPSTRRWCKRLGVDIEALLVSQPGSAEEALQIAEMLVHVQRRRHHRHRLGGGPGAQGRDRGGDRRQHVGLQARLMSQALRKLTGGVSRSKCVPDLHQPDPREDRRHVRQPRDDARRPGPEVLQLVPDRRPPDRAGQGRRGSRPARGSRSRSSRTRSRRRSASASST